MTLRRRDGRALAGLARFDLGLLAAAGGLSLLGIALTWSATLHSSGAGFALRGALNVGLGLVLAIVVLRTPAPSLRAIVPAVYAAAIVGLVAVLTPLGSTMKRPGFRSALMW